MRAALDVMQVQPPSHGTNSFFCFVEFDSHDEKYCKVASLVRKREANLASNESRMALHLQVHTYPISSALMGTPDVTHKFG